jgi:hypothetical protein
MESESRLIYNVSLLSSYAIISPIRSIFLLKRMLSLCIFISYLTQKMIKNAIVF